MENSEGRVALVTAATELVWRSGGYLWGYVEVGICFYRDLLAGSSQSNRDPNLIFNFFENQMEKEPNYRYTVSLVPI